jgi:hypothetical protein
MPSSDANRSERFRTAASSAGPDLAETTRSWAGLADVAMIHLDRFLDHHVRVRPAHAKRTQPGPSRFGSWWPGGQFGIDEERGDAEIDLRVGLLVVQARWQPAVLEAPVPP